MSITSSDEMIRTAPGERVKVRLYRPEAREGAAPIVLHLHGGAFLEGSIEQGRTVARLLAEAGAVVLSAEYPLAPAHPFPQALQAAFALLVWMDRNRGRLSDRRAPLFVAGEEAGGNLAAGLAMMARDRHMPALAGQILLSPMLDPCLGSRSIRAAEAGPVGCRWADGWQGYLGSADKAGHPYASPLGASRLAGIAPALIVTAADDPLRDEGLCYAAHLRAAGIAAEVQVMPAPTCWPEALAAGDGETPAWSAPLRDRLAQFLTPSNDGTRAPAASAHAIQA